MQRQAMPLRTAEIIALIGAAEARDRIIQEHLNQALAPSRPNGDGMTNGNG